MFAISTLRDYLFEYGFGRHQAVVSVSQSVTVQCTHSDNNWTLVPSIFCYCLLNLSAIRLAIISYEICSTKRKMFLYHFLLHPCIFFPNTSPSLITLYLQTFSPLCLPFSGWCRSKERPKHAEESLNWTYQMSAVATVSTELLVTVPTPSNYSIPQNYRLRHITITNPFQHSCIDLLYHSV